MRRRKGNLLFTLDLLYLNLEDDRTTARGLETEVGLKLLLTEFGAGYRLGTWPLSPEVLPAVSFDVLAGGRYVFLESSIDIDGGPLGGIDVERDVDWIEPFVGGRFLLTLSKRITLGVCGLDIDYTQGSGTSRGRLDVLMHGPLLGVVFRF